MKASDSPIIVEQSFAASPEKVWNAITKLDQMHNWYFDNIPDFKPVAGFETKFNVHNEGRDFLHLWKITEAIPQNKLAYTWKFEGYPGDSIVTFELIEENNNTKLILTVNILEDFPDNIPEFTRESCINGWNYFLAERLASFLKNI